MSVKSIIKKLLPWIITVGALYFAFKDIKWSLLLEHVGGANPGYLILALVLTVFSYIFRGRRWLYLFPDCKISFLDSIRVVVLGFFFNNVLPARAGEFVRAHLGAQVTGESRALVLATIASERIVDGLGISILFVCFATGIGDQILSQRLFYVAVGFAAITLGVVLTIAFRSFIFTAVNKLQSRSSSKRLEYTLDKIAVFIDGLSPLAEVTRLPIIVMWTAVIWWNELFVFYLITHAYGAQIGLPETVLMMVAVNFSSLIPSAPGGIGVIELVASSALVSIGVAQELALIMVLTQHVIQYIVICIPGALMTVTWKGRLEKIRLEAQQEELSGTIA